MANDVTYSDAYAKAQDTRVDFRNATKTVMEKYGVSALAYPFLLVKPRLIEDTASHYGSAGNRMSHPTGLPAINVPIVGYVPSSLLDISICVEAVNSIQKMDIIEGNEANRFAPTYSVICSEASKMISMVINQ